MDANLALWMPFVADRALGIPPLNITPDLGLRSIPSGIGYALCKSLHCQRCGHLFTNYRFDDDEMQRLYANYRDGNYVDLRDNYEPGYADQNKALGQGHHYINLVHEFLADLIDGKLITVLDWGGDTGKNTPFAEVAERIHLYEPSGIKPEIAKAQNVSQPEDFDSSYTLLVLSNVLEHMPFPRQTLDCLLPYMNFDSLFYIEVPFEALQQSLEAESGSNSSTNKKWHWHEHINFFSKNSLHCLIESAGLKVIRSRSIAIDPGSSNVSFSKVFQVVCRKTQTSFS